MCAAYSGKRKRQDSVLITGCDCILYEGYDFFAAGFLVIVYRHVGYIAREGILYADIRRGISAYADTRNVPVMMGDKLLYREFMTAEGQHINGSVVEVKDDVVVMDMNHPLAGCDLNFVGEVVTNRPATNEELAEMARMMSGGCGCSCDSCGGGCDDHDCGEGCCH